MESVGTGKKRKRAEGKAREKGSDWISKRMKCVHVLFMATSPLALLFRLASKLCCIDRYSKLICSKDSISNWKGGTVSM